MAANPGGLNAAFHAGGAAGEAQGMRFTKSHSKSLRNEKHLVWQNKMLES
jgi:hypothetical protein